MIASCSRHFYSNSTFKIDNDAEMYGDTVAAEYGPEAATYAPEAAKYAPEAAQYASLKSVGLPILWFMLYHQQRKVVY